MNKKVAITLLSAFLCAGSITNGMDSALVPVAKKEHIPLTTSIAMESVGHNGHLGSTLTAGLNLTIKKISDQKDAIIDAIINARIDAKKAAIINVKKAAISPARKAATNAAVAINAAEKAFEAVKNIYIRSLVATTLICDATYQGLARLRTKEAKLETKAEKAFEAVKNIYIRSIVATALICDATYQGLARLRTKKVTPEIKVEKTKRSHFDGKLGSETAANATSSCTAIVKKVADRTNDELKKDIATVESQISEYAKRIVEAERRTAAAKATQVKLQATIDASKKQK